MLRPRALTRDRPASKTQSVCQPASKNLNRVDPGWLNFQTNSNRLARYNPSIGRRANPRFDRRFDQRFDRRFVG